MKFDKEKKIFIKILDALGFVFQRVGKHGDIWRHEERNIITNLPHTPSDHRWIKSKKLEISKFISDAFTLEEVKELLQTFIKKRKIDFTQDGRVRLLRVSKESVLKEKKLYQKEQDDWRKILNDLPTDLDLEGELLILLLNRGKPNSEQKVNETIKELTDDVTDAQIGASLPKILPVKKISKDKDKEELKKLKKKKKVLEDKLLEEIRKLASSEK